MSSPSQPALWRDGSILLRRHPVTGGEVFDLQLAAAMLANGITRIYTYNCGDFAGFEELVVSEPQTE